MTRCLVVIFKELDLFLKLNYIINIMKNITLLPKLAIWYDNIKQMTKYEKEHTRLCICK